MQMGFLNRRNKASHLQKENLFIMKYQVGAFTNCCHASGHGTRLLCLSYNLKK